MPELQVRLELPIPSARADNESSIVFTRWLPLQETDAISLSRGRFTVKFWFNILCTDAPSEYTEEELPRWINVNASRIFADVVIAEIPSALLAYMRQRKVGQPVPAESQEIQDEYDAIAIEALMFVLNRFNRMMAAIRTMKGQYWLGEYDPDPGFASSYFTQFKTKARFEKTDWFRFGSSTPHRLTIRNVSEKRFISATEWEHLRSFVIGTARPPLWRALLAGAELLASERQNRAALTEAVTALEVMLYSFAAAPQANAAFGPVLAQRLGLGELRAQVARMGFTRSISYLLPVILPEAVLPQALLERCRTAIADRQNVVHQGQRDVQAKILRAHIAAIRRLCELLERLTQDPTCVELSGD